MLPGPAAQLYDDCALLRDGQLACHRAAAKFERVEGIADARAMVGDSWDGCARLGDGSVRCWARPKRGAARDRDAPLTARALPGLSEVVELRGESKWLRCARTRAGEVHCWGERARALGDRLPAADPGIDDAIAIDVYDHLCAVRRTGALVYGAYGQRAAFPVEPIPEIDSAVEVQVRSGGQCVRTRGGAVRCVGESYPDPGFYRVVTVLGAQDVTRLDDSFWYPCAIIRGGQRLCWEPSRRREPTARRVPGLDDTRVFTGRCALERDGHVSCWTGGHRCYTSGPLRAAEPGRAPTSE
ncbi:MAG: hypothetical protein H6729_00035 [Deltaproteobacteria bacterium]|nr:hypothetical protein [Deltaproteobacteria bacterium]